MTIQLKIVAARRADEIEDVERILDQIERLQAEAAEKLFEALRAEQVDGPAGDALVIKHTAHPLRDVIRKFKRAVGIHEVPVSPNGTSANVD